MALFGETDSQHSLGNMMGTILPEEDKLHHKYSIKQQCFPLYSLLLALNNPTINLFSLDIEGLENQVNTFTLYFTSTSSLSGTAKHSLELG